jgi:hypothetical protein
LRYKAHAAEAAVHRIEVGFLIQMRYADDTDVLALGHAYQTAEGTADFRIAVGIDTRQIAGDGVKDDQPHIADMLNRFFQFSQVLRVCDLKQRIGPEQFVETIDFRNIGAVIHQPWHDDLAEIIFIAEQKDAAGGSCGAVGPVAARLCMLDIYARLSRSISVPEGLDND